MSATAEKEGMKSAIVRTVAVVEKEGQVVAVVENAEAAEAGEEDSNYQIFKLN